MKTSIHPLRQNNIQSLISFKQISALRVFWDLIVRSSWFDPWKKWSFPCPHTPTYLHRIAELQQLRIELIITFHLIPHLIMFLLSKHVFFVWNSTLRNYQNRQSEHLKLRFAHSGCSPWNVWKFTRKRLNLPSPNLVRTWGLWVLPHGTGDIIFCWI